MISYEDLLKQAEGAGSINEIWIVSSMRHLGFYEYAIRYSKEISDKLLSNQKKNRKKLGDLCYTMYEIYNNPNTKFYDKEKANTLLSKGKTYGNFYCSKKI